MSSNYSAVSVSGRLSWNINPDVSSVFSAATKWINIFGAFFEFIVIVFFLAMFSKKNSGFREPYFVIYTMGLFVDATPKVFTFFHTHVYSSPVLFQAFSFFDWYNKNFITLWNLLLALNRFTAIFFSLDFSRIWSKRNTAIICVLLILYPFIIHCFNPLYMWCRILGVSCPASLKLSVKLTDFETYFAYISDITYAVLAAILCTITAIRILIKKQMLNQKVEIVLLIQSFTSAVFLILSTVTSWLASVNGQVSIVDMSELLRSVKLQQFLSVISKFFYDIHHYVGLFLLFVGGRHFRTKFLEFYRINLLLKRFETKNQVGPLMIDTAPAPTASNNPGISTTKVTPLR